MISHVVRIFAGFVVALPLVSFSATGPEQTGLQTTEQKVTRLRISCKIRGASEYDKGAFGVYAGDKCPDGRVPGKYAGRIKIHQIKIYSTVEECLEDKLAGLTGIARQTKKAMEKPGCVSIVNPMASDRG